MWRRIKDLPSDQRLALEKLIGRSLQDDEGVNIQASLMLRDAPTGQERSQSHSRYLGHLDQLSERVKDTPDQELDAIIDEACERVQHPSS